MDTMSIVSLTALCGGVLLSFLALLIFYPALIKKDIKSLQSEGGLVAASEAVGEVFGDRDDMLGMLAVLGDVLLLVSPILFGYSEIAEDFYQSLRVSFIVDIIFGLYIVAVGIGVFILFCCIFISGDLDVTHVLGLNYSILRCVSPLMFLTLLLYIFMGRGARKQRKYYARKQREHSTTYSTRSSSSSYSRPFSSESTSSSISEREKERHRIEFMAEMRRITYGHPDGGPGGYNPIGYSGSSYDPDDK